MAYTTDTYVLYRDWNKATITYEITNFAAAVAANKKGKVIVSKECTIGGTQFTVVVYPSGNRGAGKDMVSIFTRNSSKHKVSFDHSIAVGDVKMSGSNVLGEGNSGWGRKDFMVRKDVGANLAVVVDITLLREEVGSTDRGVVGRTFLKETVKEVLETGGVLEGMKRQADNLEELKTEMKKMKQELALARGPVKIPECVICLEELRPPLKIVQCIQGHKVCEPCSKREEEVKACPTCRTGFLGRDYGMETFVRQLLGEQE